TGSRHHFAVADRDDGRRMGSMRAGTGWKRHRSDFRTAAPAPAGGPGAILMTWLLDTDTCVNWLRNTEPRLTARIQQCDPAEIVLCSVVVAELLFGVERSDPAHRAKSATSVARLRQLFASLPFEDAAAEHYGRIRADLTAQG